MANNISFMLKILFGVRRLTDAEHAIKYKGIVKTEN